jgi:hypothetical protein
MCHEEEVNPINVVLPTWHTRPRLSKVNECRESRP